MSGFRLVIKERDAPTLECMNQCFSAVKQKSFFPLQKHARRVYEILRLRATDMSDEEQAREYRLEVKKRLFGPYKVELHSYGFEMEFFADHCGATRDMRRESDFLMYSQINHDVCCCPTINRLAAFHLLCFAWCSSFSV